MTVDKARSVPVLEPKTLVDGRFEVEKEIGRGGMGVLYRAIDVHLQRPCALKLLRGKYSYDRERLRREAAALAAVRNEHVVDVYTFGLHQEIPYFAMEFVVGMNLAAIVREHAAHNNVFVPIRRAAQILCDLCDALSAIHKVGIVHRDVKPDNVIVEDHTGRSVLVDFGSAALGDEGDEIVGTPGYFAPETLFTPKSTPAQDLYSFGCLAYHLLTNKPPYAGREFEELLRQHAKAPIPKPSLLRAELAPFDELFTELLAKDPADRLSNAAIVRNALEDRLSIALAASPVESATHEPVPDERRRHARNALVARARRGARLGFVRRHRRAVRGTTGDRGHRSERWSAVGRRGARRETQGAVHAERREDHRRGDHGWARRGIVALGRAAGDRVVVPGERSAVYFVHLLVARVARVERGRRGRRHRRRHQSVRASLRVHPHPARQNSRRNDPRHRLRLPRLARPPPHGPRLRRDRPRQPRPQRPARLHQPRDLHPLHGILGLATVLDEAGLSSEQRELVRALKNSGRALNRIVDDVLDMARVDAGLVSITPRPTDLFAVIEDVIDLFAADAANKGVSLVVVAEGVEHFSVHVDEDRFRQVLSNLVRNALKFTEAGSVVVRATASAHDERRSVRVRVEDTGPGLTDAQIDRLFERFSQPNLDLARAHGGAGLGLALARDLTVRMGGSLSAERGRASGACFVIELDLARCEPLSARPVCAARVLIVEGDHLYAEAAESIARSIGARVHVARTLVEAVDRCSSQQYDAVIIGQSAAVDAIEAQATLVLCQHRPKKFIAATSVSASALTRAANSFDQVLLRPVRRARVCEAASSVGAVASTPPPAAAVRARSARALVVDVDSTNRRLLTRLLEARGWNCTATESASAALDALDDRPFDVVLCDLHMANMSGIELLHAARSRGHKLPFVVVTASVLEQDRRRCREAGFDYFLRKPFEPEDLDAILVTIVGAETAPIESPIATQRRASVSPDPAQPAPAEPLLSEEKFSALAEFLGGELDIAVREFVEEAARYGEALCDGDRDNEERRRAVHNLGSSALAMGLLAVGVASRSLESRWAQTALEEQLREGAAIRALFERSRAELEATLARRAR